MTINDKVKEITRICGYKFNGMIFTLYKEDLIRIYDKVDGVCLFSTDIKEEFEIPDELANKEYKKEELIKMPDRHFAVCFYLDAPEKIEQPISARSHFI